MKTSNTCKRFLQTLLAALKEKGCEPVLLRNYEDLPNSMGNDLDIYVNPQKLHAACTCFLEQAYTHGFTITHIHKRSYFTALWLNFDDMVAPVHIDLYHGATTWHGLEYLNCAELPLNSEPHPTFKDAHIPTPWHEALISSMTSILWGGFFKERYTQRIKKLLSGNDNSDNFNQHMRRVFGFDGETLSKAITSENPCDYISKSIKHKLCRHLFLKSMQLRPVHTLAKWLHFWGIEAWCYLHRRPGLTIEYNAHSISPKDKDDMLSSLTPYFGSSIEISSNSACIMLKHSFAARGRNYLLLVRSDKSAVNGKKIVASDDSIGAELLLNQALITLKDRAKSCYSSW